MTATQVIENLTKLFITRYGKKFAELNKNVYPAAKNDKGSFEVPVPVLGSGGGTLVTGNENKPLDLPAMVSVSLKNMQAQRLIYRIAIPYSECEIACNKPEYFAYLFDAIVNKAIGNYEKTVGGPDIVRFGENYCTYEQADGTIFKSDDNGQIELRLSGCWASNKEDYT